MQCMSYRNPDPASPTWRPGGFERARTFGCLERSGSRGSPRAQPAREERASGRSGFRRWDSLVVGDRPEVRENVRGYHAQIEGAGELAVEVFALGVDMVVPRRTVVVVLSFHVRRSARPSGVQQSVRRRSSGEDAALEECKREYPESAQIPDGSRCQHHDGAVIPLEPNGSPKSYGSPTERVKPEPCPWCHATDKREGTRVLGRNDNSLSITGKGCQRPGRWETRLSERPVAGGTWA